MSPTDPQQIILASLAQHTHRNAVPAVPVAPTVSVPFNQHADSDRYHVITAPTGAYEITVWDGGASRPQQHLLASLRDWHNVTDRSTTDNTCVSSANTTHR